MFHETKAARINCFGGPESSNPSEDSPPHPFVDLRHILPSHVDIVSPYEDQLMRFIPSFREENGNHFEIELALREALVNVMVHGNQKDHRKYIYVRCRCATDGEVLMTVDDEGNGFEHDSVPDPTSAGHRLRTHGRGIYLIRTLMDEVDFERSASVVHMRKKANSDSNTTRKPQ